MNNSDLEAMRAAGRAGQSADKTTRDKETNHDSRHHEERTRLTEARTGLISRNQFMSDIDHLIYSKSWLRQVLGNVRRWDQPCCAYE